MGFFFTSSLLLLDAAHTLVLLPLQSLLQSMHLLYLTLRFALMLHVHARLLLRSST